MNCTKCKAQWTPPQNRVVTKCPFCGEQLFAPKIDGEPIEPYRVLLEIVRQFGSDTLGQSRLKGLLADLMPHAEKRHLRILRQAVDDGIGAKLLEMQSDTHAVRTLKITTLKENFRNNNAFNYTADYVVDCLTYALGWLELTPQEDINTMQVNNRRVLQQSIDMAFSDGILTKEEAKSLFAQAETLKIPINEVVSLIAREIKPSQFKTGFVFDSDTLSKETILLHNWRSKSEINAKKEEYESVKIGDQIWMKRNLDVSHFRNGDPIPEVVSSVDWERAGYEKQPAWCYYNNDPEYDENYGKLYNWYAVIDPRGLAPENWHIPSDEEWTLLITFLGGREVAGGKMKTPGVKQWKKPNKGAMNSCGFSGIPGGECKGNFYDYGYSGNWWSTSEHTPSGNIKAIKVSLYNTHESIAKTSEFKDSGLNIRCVKNGVNYIDSVKIGDQIWMKRNLDVSHFRNGDPIPEVKSDELWNKAGEEGKPAWCYYNNDPENGKVYGKLYNWFAVNDSRGLAPEGWHVPSDDEWIILEKTYDKPSHEVIHNFRLLFDFNFSNAGMRGYDIGKKLKSKTGWAENGNGYDQFLFEALPGGDRSYRYSFRGLGEHGEWWSSTEESDVHAWHRLLTFDKNSIGRYSYFKFEGRSVRCLKDS